VALGEVRRSQLISIYGPGSLVPVDEHSYMVMGIDHWEDGRDLDIHEPRLQRHLGVSHFLLPPSSDDVNRGRDIPVTRFPRTYSCSNCHELGLYGRLATTEGVCARCAHRLVTSRFVVVCDAGHAMEFPYHRWAHRRAATQEPPGPDHRLRLRSLGRNASLEDIVVSCSCGASETMRGALGSKALFGVTRCHGNRPWLRDGDEEQCDNPPRAVQRGASNVWQPSTASTISIPPWSEEAARIIERFWDVISELPADVLELTLNRLADQRGLIGGGGELHAAFRSRRQLLDGDPPTVQDLRKDEWAALRRGRPETGRGQEFVCTEPDPEEEIPRPVAAVRLVSRLREVRALTGFTRLSVRSGEAGVASISKAPLGWFPAIEVSGEGIFVELDAHRLAVWERDPAVVARMAVLGGPTTPSGHPRPVDQIPTPRRVLLHSLAHALIDQWALDCGYPASSLRERLYDFDEMAGILIYTATSDSAGSLGGVVGMATAGRFAASLREALRRASWCSNDPLCLESGASGVDSSNLGACHACLLVPETSCEIGNMLLDRGVLVGTDRSPGFFADLLRD